jgi:hypothetical protein
MIMASILQDAEGGFLISLLILLSVAACNKYWRS